MIADIEDGKIENAIDKNVPCYTVCFSDILDPDRVNA
jgi:hypothetical protein